MQIGRKIYYLLSSGTVLCDTGEREGEVKETTIEEDFTIYPELQGHSATDTSYIQLDFGQDNNKFGKYNYNVDITNKTITWGSLIPVPTPGLTVDEIIEQQVKIKMGEKETVLKDSVELLQENGVV